jgi:hypothetical protein
MQPSSAKPGVLEATACGGGASDLDPGRPQGKKTDTPKVYKAVLVRFLGQIEPELKKTKWNKFSDFLSSLFLVYQYLGPEGVWDIHSYC